MYARPNMIVEPRTVDIRHSQLSMLDDVPANMLLTREADPAGLNFCMD